MVEEYPFVNEKYRTILEDPYLFILNPDGKREIKYHRATCLYLRRLPKDGHYDYPKVAADTINNLKLYAINRQWSARPCQHCNPD